MTVFATLSYTHEIPTVLYNSSLKRVFRFGRSLPVLFIIGSGPVRAKGENGEGYMNLK